MVGSIFNLAVPCMFTASALSLSLWTTCLAYIESIMIHIVNSCANDIDHTENNGQSQCVFLSALAWFCL